MLACQINIWKCHQTRNIEWRLKSNTVASQLHNKAPDKDKTDFRDLHLGAVEERCTARASRSSCGSLIMVTVCLSVCLSVSAVRMITLSGYERLRELQQGKPLSLFPSPSSCLPLSHRWQPDRLHRLHKLTRWSVEMEVQQPAERAEACEAERGRVGG